MFQQEFNWVSLQPLICEKREDVTVSMWLQRVEEGWRVWVSHTTSQPSSSLTPTQTIRDQSLSGGTKRHRCFPKRCFMLAMGWKFFVAGRLCTSQTLKTTLCVWMWCVGRTSLRALPHASGWQAEGCGIHLGWIYLSEIKWQLQFNWEAVSLTDSSWIRDMWHVWQCKTTTCT